MSGELEAVVFDCDGLIIDSETVIFESAVEAFAAHGHQLTMDAWSLVVGTHDNDGDAEWERLCAALGVTFAKADYLAAYEALDRSNRDTLPALPGVRELVAELEAAGVPMGVASSSSFSWVERHVQRLELHLQLTALVGRDTVGHIGKPEPDVYLHACALLGADPAKSVALEDSGHGVASAKAAGMVAVAVPTLLTRPHDFSAADLVVASLTELDVPTLTRLVANRDR
jgi:HAD superfamily hydrolase (TIGR01509 family)